MTVRTVRQELAESVYQDILRAYTYGGIQVAMRDAGRGLEQQLVAAVMRQDPTRVGQALMRIIGKNIRLEASLIVEQKLADGQLSVDDVESILERRRAG